MVQWGINFEWRNATFPEFGFRNEALLSGCARFPTKCHKGWCPRYIHPTFMDESSGNWSWYVCLFRLFVCIDLFTHRAIISNLGMYLFIKGITDVLLLSQNDYVVDVTRITVSSYYPLRWYYSDYYYSITRYGSVCLWFSDASCCAPKIQNVPSCKNKSVTQINMSSFCQGLRAGADYRGGGGELTEDNCAMVNWFPSFVNITQVYMYGMSFSITFQELWIRL